jgi:3-phenylpropionate/trans-cinnamate dioxygenase ferredoxin subunit
VIPSSVPSDGQELERVCAAADVAPGTLHSFTLSDGTRACVGNARGSIFAVSDRCPHQQFPLSDGELTADGAIVCSRHGAAFDCTTGRALRGPVRDRGEYEAPLGRLAVYETQIINGDVHVRPPGMPF